MKKITALLLLTLSPTLSGAEAPPFLIKNHRIGLLSTGMTARDVSTHYPADRVKVWEPYPRVQVIDIFADAGHTNGPAFRLNLDRSGRAYSIEVQDKRCQTEKGITLGSTFGNLRKAYPNLRIGSQEGEMDQFIQAEVVAEGIHFYLKFDQDLWKRVQQQPNRLDVDPTIIPNDALITGIMVT